ncbi:hypothetical protein BUALT_Bualt19G0029800 [Buddleja alternifolia]|uniref:Uncharacterized protein n=1 Tax=Buddleja alternifolia TaxID=168488 RepID=A0AAV6W934_9LAMI|nr:hypothetical protein BUALT_Bualt19G0029800 [Buddleja alternifolia]
MPSTRKTRLNFIKWIGTPGWEEISPIPTAFVTCVQLTTRSRFTVRTVLDTFSFGIENLNGELIFEREQWKSWAYEHDRCFIASILEDTNNTSVICFAMDELNVKFAQPNVMDEMTKDNELAMEYMVRGDPAYVQLNQISGPHIINISSDLSRSNGNVISNMPTNTIVVEDSYEDEGKTQNKDKQILRKIKGRLGQVSS